MIRCQARSGIHIADTTSNDYPFDTHPASLPPGKNGWIYLYFPVMWMLTWLCQAGWCIPLDYLNVCCCVGLILFLAEHELSLHEAQLIQDKCNAFISFLMETKNTNMYISRQKGVKPGEIHSSTSGSISFGNSQRNIEKWGVRLLFS